MDFLVAITQKLLPVLGPWLVLAMAMAETSFFTGLVVPAGVATAMGGFLATKGVVDIWQIFGAAVLGGLVGDSCGYWVGRQTGRSVGAPRGLVARLLARSEPRAASLFSRHPIYAVSLARLVSFVRTLMPWAAGSSGLPYPRFLAYDVLGVVGWAGAYAAVGYLAGASWERVTGYLGTGVALLFLFLALAAWAAGRRGALQDAARLVSEDDGGAPEIDPGTAEGEASGEARRPGAA